MTELARVLGEDLEARSAEMARRVFERVPFYGENRHVTREELEASFVENLRFVIPALGSGQPTDPEPAAATGVRRALEGVPLPAVLAAYRVGFRGVWEYVVAEAGRRGIPAETVVAATAEAIEAHDVFTEAMSAAYNATVTARIVSREAERSAVVEAVLSGTVLDRRTLWEAADILGLPLDGRYAVAAVVLEQSGRFVLPTVESDLAQIGFRSAWRLVPDAQVGIIDLGDRHPDQLVEALEAAGSARIGLSPAFEDLTGAASGLEMARLAARTSAPGAGVLRFEDRPVGVAVAAAGDIMDRVAAEVLGPLESLAESERYTVLETLRVWIEVGGSASKAATRLFCHANTVRYRLRRFEEKTGRRLDQPSDVAAVCLALEATRH